MAIIFGLFIAAALIYGWARGYWIVAIMGSLAVLFFGALLMGEPNNAMFGLCTALIMMGIVWTPILHRTSRAKPLPVVTVRTQQVARVH